MSILLSIIGLKKNWGKRGGIHIKNKITILADNKAEESLVSEHGFSLILEIQGKRILFDTGQGEALFKNAAILGVSLKNLDYLVLSHGHYDHGGNVAKIIDLNPSIEFFAHPDCLINRYSFHKGKPVKPVALSKKNRESILRLPDKQLHWCRDKNKIMKGVFVTGEIPRVNNYEDTGGAFFLDSTMDKKDFILDDLSLWIEGDRGLTVICGCCHSGLQNTIRQILSFNESANIDMIIGGLHLVNAGEIRIKNTISYINKIDVNGIIGAHCSGEKVLNQFKEQLKAEVSAGTVGKSISI